MVPDCDACMLRHGMYRSPYCVPHLLVVASWLDVIKHSSANAALLPTPSINVSQDTDDDLERRLHQQIPNGNRQAIRSSDHFQMWMVTILKSLCPIPTYAKPSMAAPRNYNNQPNITHGNLPKLGERLLPTHLYQGKCTLCPHGYLHGRRVWFCI